jgi:hypothetical protein
MEAGAKIAVRLKPALACNYFERQAGMPQQILGTIDTQLCEVLGHGNPLQTLKEVAQVVLAYTGVSGHFSHAVNRTEVLLHELSRILNKDLLRIGNRAFAFRDRAKPQEKRRDTKVQDA